MNKNISGILIILAVTAGTLLFMTKWMTAPELPADVSAKQEKVFEATGKITFYELGGEGCKACEAMRPVMATIEEKYGDLVDVVFHDVKIDTDLAKKLRVLNIPTQVFVDANGEEFFRHQGFYPLEDVEEIFSMMGVKTR